MPERMVPQVQWRQAVVESLNLTDPPSVDVTMDGGVIGPVRFLSSYVPVAGDAVWLVQTDHDRQIVGKSTDSGDPTTEGIVRRIATAKATANSADITTTETVIGAVSAAVVVQRIYRVTFFGSINNSQVGSTALVRIKEDDETGTLLQVVRIFAHSAGANYPLTVETEYQADATEDKLLVATLVRATGTGNHRLVASATQPSFTYVDHIRQGTL